MNTLSFFAAAFLRQEALHAAALVGRHPGLRAVLDDLDARSGTWSRHSPARERIPPFAAEWFEAYAAGRDVVRWYDGPAAG